MRANRPNAKSGILDISPYVPGKSAASPGIKSVKLSSNESPLGASSKVGAALAQLNGKYHEYPDAAANGLRDAISTVHGLNLQNLICGNGSDDLLSMLANAYLAPGDEAIHTEHGFLYYPIVIRASGATPVVAREVECTANVDNILAVITPRTKIIFLANPNNPTGTYLPIDEVRRLHAGLPKETLLVVDAAYAEYVQRNDYESGIELVSANENVVMTRTFSKIHGLAAMRVGWAYAPSHIIDVLNRIRGPFNVNAFALAAGEAAIRDTTHIQEAIAHNNEWLVWVTNQLEKIGLKVTPSVGNFILIHFPDEKLSAKNADIALSKEGYILRAVAGYGFPNALRMTIGNKEENQSVVRILNDFMKGEASNGSI